MDPDTILRGALPPILAALLFVSIGGVRLLPLAMAAGLFVAYWLLRREMPDTPVRLWNNPDGRQWLLWVVIAAALLAALEHLRVLTKKVAGGIGVALATVGVYLMLSKQASQFSGGQIALWIVAGGLAAGLLVFVCRRALTRAPSGIAAAVVFVVLLSADSVLLTLGGSALLGQLCGVVAAAVGAGAATVLWRKGFSLTVAEGTWFGAAHALFVMSGTHLADLPRGAMALALFAPVALLVVPRAEPGKGAARWCTLALLALAVPMGIALWLAAQQPAGD